MLRDQIGRTADTNPPSEVKYHNMLRNFSQLIGDKVDEEYFQYDKSKVYKNRAVIQFVHEELTKEYPPVFHFEMLLNVLIATKLKIPSQIIQDIFSRNPNVHLRMLIANLVRPSRIVGAEEFVRTVLESKQTPASKSQFFSKAFVFLDSDEAFHLVTKQHAFAPCEAIVAVLQQPEMNYWAWAIDLAENLSAEQIVSTEVYEYALRIVGYEDVNAIINRMQSLGNKMKQKMEGSGLRI
ncbi:MAG: hypothetical protein JST40_11755 [Armatimonadetes bacterium]|nr:hypothetical protein [Armatimonadota bacterium]